MRVDVKKYLFIGASDEKSRFFKKAQKEGFINFISTGATTHKEIPVEVQEVTSAIKILRHQPPVEQEENFKLVTPETIVENILRLNDENEKLLEDLRMLSLEIERIEIFGDFSLEDIDYIERNGNRKIQFFCARPSVFKDAPPPPEVVYVASDHGLDFYVAINPQIVHYDKMIEIKIDHPLGVVKKKYNEELRKQHDIEHELKNYAKYNTLLHHLLISRLNKYHLYSAETYVQDTMEGSLFAVEGWIPSNQIDRLPGLIDDMHVYADEIALEPNELPPTYLENTGAERLGQDLVSIYDTPSPTDNDPSMWVLGSFTLFFAFIMADAGYGLIYLLLALFLRYKYPGLKGLKKRMLDLFTLLSVGCIVWGLLTTSFFGMNIGIDNPIRKVSLLQWLVEKKAEYHIVHQDSTYQEWVTKYPDLANVKDPHQFVSYIPAEEGNQTHKIFARLSDNVMFELALFIGIAHLILSLLRYIRRNWHGAGWIAFLLGAYLYFASYLNAPSILNYVGGIDLENGGRIGFQLMIGGIAFAVIAAIIKYGIVGVFEVMNLIQVFADVLSYLRLYALGLAGAIVGATINEIAGTLPFVLGVLLVLVSHFVNIVLCTMSGVIHGLRLNFIEWYHYSFEGGGKEFRPLKLMKIE
ncbi:MAG: V-type ATP synthase subunit I [Parachlamydiaceae bacterium]|nr:V-type ATP synthase subunit I [Parachlamydiaceae bacterium]